MDIIEKKFFAKRKYRRNSYQYMHSLREKVIRKLKTVRGRKRWLLKLEVIFRKDEDRTLVTAFRSVTYYAVNKYQIRKQVKRAISKIKNNCEDFEEYGSGYILYECSFLSLKIIPF
jgi:hypothetical protein